MSQEHALEKVRALMRLALSASPNEAGAAALQAVKLIERAGLEVVARAQAAGERVASEVERQTGRPFREVVVDVATEAAEGAIRNVLSDVLGGRRRRR